MKKALHLASLAAALLLAAPATAQDYTEGANTYIITEAGEHSFLPVHVDGTPITIASADWLWAEKDPTDTEQQIISDVRLADDGTVHFRYSGSREGNALIAGFDAEGKIVWNWLIWCTDRPIDVKMDQGSYFQDRLLGAVGSSQLGVTDHAHPEAWSPLGWQWGRAVPTFNGYNQEYTAMTEPQQYTQINPAYADSHAWKADLTQAVSIETATANPTVWYTYSGGTDNWYTSDDNTLWSADEKTNYDPCPEGYKVPDQDDFGNFGTVAELTSIYGFTYTNSDGETQWWRGCGSGRHFEDAKYDAVASANSTPIYYHLSDMYTGWGTPYPKRLLLQTDPSAMKFTPFSGGLRCASYNVRCVRYKGDPVTAVKRVEAAADLSIRASEDRVDAFFPAGQYTQLAITDAAGRTLKTVQVPAASTQLSISLPPTVRGFYMVKALSGHRAVARKLVRP